MTSELLRRALATGFAAALLLGGAACGDDDEGDNTDLTEEPEIDEGLGGTDDPDTGIDAGEGLGGTDDAGEEADAENPVEGEVEVED